MFTLHSIRQNLYNLFLSAKWDFLESPTEENARTLNAISKLMYNVLLCENDYAGLCEEAYQEKGLLKTEWWADWKSDGAYTQLMEEIAHRGRILRKDRENYTALALQAFDNFTDGHVHTITFDPNGGVLDEYGTTRLYRAKRYAEPLTLDVTQPFGNEGYVFAGKWSLTPDGEGNYLHGDTVSNIGDATTNDKSLYAVWRDVSADVLYDYADNPTGENVTTVTDTVDISAGAV